MRVFIAESYKDRGRDAMGNNPGNLYFTYGLGDQLPLGCPFTAAEARSALADYIVCGPQGWALVKDATGGMRVVAGPYVGKKVMESRS